jgi:hypothetical protein
MQTVIIPLVAAISAILLISFISSLPVMLLWDWLMPEIFGLKEITWLQAWGLSVLCGFLFKANITQKD